MGCKISNFSNNDEIDLTLTDLDDTQTIQDLSNSCTYPFLNTITRHRHLLTLSNTLFHRLFQTLKLLHPLNPSQQALLAQWGSQVFEYFQNLSVMNLLSIQSTGQQITLIHQIQGQFDMSVLRYFIESNNSLPLNLDAYLQAVKFVHARNPQFVSAYISFGEILDIGIIIQMPMQKREVKKIIGRSVDAERLFEWSAANKYPKPVCAQISLLRNSARIKFYCFEDSRPVNYTKAFGIFQAFGCPVSTEIFNFLLKSCGDQMLACVTFEDGSVQKIGVQVQSLNQSEKMESLVDTKFDTVLWERFQNLIGAGMINFDITNQGFVLTQTSVLF